MDWIIEGFRMILWGITAGIMFLMDIAYEIIRKIILIDFLETKDLWDFWSGIMLFLGLFVVVRIVLIMMKLLFVEEERQKFNYFGLFVRLGLISLAMVLTPFAIKGIGSLGMTAVSNIHLITGTADNTEPSSILLTSNLNINNGYFDTNGSWVDEGKVVYTLEDIEINASDPTGVEKYKFFSNLSDLFIMALIGGAASLMLLVIALQIGKRTFEVAILVLASPIPISSIINEKSDIFMTWLKMIVSVYMTNFFQLLSLLIVMILGGSVAVSKAGFWASIIMLLAGFLFVLNGVPQISRLIGGDTSAGSTLQQLASLRMAGAGFGKMSAGFIGGGLGMAKQGISKMKDRATYGIGRALGGVSLGQFNQLGGNNGFNFSSVGGGGKIPRNNAYSSAGSGANPFAPEREQNVSFDSSYGSETQARQNLRQSIQAKEQGQIEQIGLSRTGTKAANYADKAIAMKGFKGKLAQKSVQVAKHSYVKSMQNISNGKRYQKREARNQLAKPRESFSRLS